MQIKFKDGTIKKCSNPIEQKIFRNGEAAGWICSFSIYDAMNSSDVDSILTEDNIAVLTFCDDSSVELFAIIGFSKVSSAIVRHAEKDGTVEIQLTKSKQ